MRGTSHQAIMSESPISAPRELESVYYWTGSVGGSIMKLPLTDKVKEAYEDFEVSRSNLPQELMLSRAHLSFILGSKMNLGFSFFLTT